MNYLFIIFTIIFTYTVLCKSKGKIEQDLKQFRTKKVIDAQTIVGIFEGENEEVTIKLYGISPPDEEKDYKYAQIMLEKLVKAHIFGVKVINIDEAGIIKGILYGKTDTLNTSLLKLGLVKWNSNEASNQINFKEIEERAKKGRMGIWKPKRPINNEL